MLFVGFIYGYAQTDNVEVVSTEQMLQRFLKYVAVPSQSQATVSGEWNLTPAQVDMARMLEADALALGADVYRSEDAYVYVTIPSNSGDDVPVFGISCHLDYTPEAPGDSIVPIVIRNYAGGDIIQGDGRKIAVDSPEGADLAGLVGKTLVHTDGTTLLGGDDKNGCTIAMSVIETLMTQPDLRHGRVLVVFCPNEDIGLAASRIDTTRFNPDILFDVDGSGRMDISNENFSARGLDLLFKGKYAHPAEAKSAKLGDALAAAAAYIASVPLQYRPEATDGKQGYIHPWNLTTDANKLDYVVNTRIRYFDQEEGLEFDRILRAAIDSIRTAFPNVEVEILLDAVQYENVAYNMHPRSVEIITRASEINNTPIRFKSERGGTTAAMFTAIGLRGGMCLFSGQHAIHSTSEYSCIEEMHDAYRLLVTAILLTP